MSGCSMRDNWASFGGERDSRPHQAGMHQLMHRACVALEQALCVCRVSCEQPQAHHRVMLSHVLTSRWCWICSCQHTPECGLRGADWESAPAQAQVAETPSGTLLRLQPSLTCACLTPRRSIKLTTWFCALPPAGLQEPCMWMKTAQ